MQTAIMKDHDYKGPTRNPQGEALERLTNQFRTVTGPAQLKKALKAWGLDNDVSPRQARFWQSCTDVEKTLFVDMATVSRTYALTEWEAIPPKIRGRIWRAIGDAATWGERLKGRW